VRRRVAAAPRRKEKESLLWGLAAGAQAWWTRDSRSERAPERVRWVGRCGRLTKKKKKSFEPSFPQSKQEGPPCLASSREKEEEEEEMDLG